MPAAELVDTTRPYPCSRMRSHAGWVTLKAPFRCTSITGSTRSAVMLGNDRSRKMPALLTTMSMRPKASSADRTIASPPSTVATELVSATATPPAAVISSTTVWAAPALAPVPSTAPPRSFTTTNAPRAASRRACWRPSPPPAPVTIATLPSNPSSAIGRKVAAGPGRSPLEGAGAGVQGAVVELAVGRPPDRVDGGDAAGRLVAGEVRLDVGDERARVDDVTALGLDQRSDRLAEALVGNADHGGVGHVVVALEHLLDLLGVHLLAAGVDALAPPAEQAHGAVRG